MPEQRHSPGTVWARVEDGFHVGSRDGNFLGYIEQRKDGRYVAFDMRSAAIGTFSDLVSAMRTLSSAPAPTPGILSIRENR
ncbi:hypothetical protein [Microbacterium oleivorans]|uniref:hypothetical protein n=1 Tax=Microbacterium oleivorans TaxID=273677 RepID=UPI000767DA0D|nr:hypothetical protein [Microbacterium oleivorans]AZS43081.1 hypothetical protein BWL13_00623 [Microbacterium oleivorans]THE08188.1 hypothetical protein E1I21_04225 [Microbacterium oleivorans]